MNAKLKPLADQVIVITGASSGIGLATAQKAAQAGASLVLVARSADTLDAIKSRLSQTGAKVTVVIADVADRESVQNAADVAIAKYGRIDTWINNAGVAIYGRLGQVSEQDNRRLFDTNFWGVVNGSTVALPYLKAGGALINLGSEVSDAVVPLQGMYTASKHAVKGFTDALRVEVEKIDNSPIAVVLIQPTAVNTPYPQHARNYMPFEPRLPTPQIDPDDVADAILRAAVSGGRDIRVGAMATMNVMLSRLMPGVADSMAAKQAARQQRSEAPQDPAGTLFKAGEGGQVRGLGA